MIGVCVQVCAFFKTHQRVHSRFFYCVHWGEKNVQPKRRIVSFGALPGISLEGMMLKLKLQYFGHLMRRVDSFEKDSDAGRDWGQEEKGKTENEMAGWHH